MPGIWTTIQVKDGSGAPKTLRAWDESGSGVGPWTIGNMLVDGSGSGVSPSIKPSNVPAVASDTALVVSNRDPVKLSSQGLSAQIAVMRPNNTTAYGAGAVVGGPITFSNLAPVGGGEILITSAMLRIDDSAVISGEASYRLHLYSITPPSAYADGATWDLAAGDRASYLGYVDFGAPVDVGSTLYVEVDGVHAQKKAASAALYGYLVTNGAYTPSANRVYNPELHAVAS